MRRVARLLALCAALCAAPTAHAAEEPTILYHGYAVNPHGVPVSGSFTLTFTLFDAPTGGSEVWSETHATSVTNGTIAVALGSTTPLGASLFAGNALYMGIKVDNVEQPNRQPIGWVPLALRSLDTAGLAGQPVISTGCAPGHALSFTDTGWTCAPSGVSFSAGDGIEISGTVISLPTGCATNEVLKWTGSTWGCAGDSDTPPAVAAGSGLQLSGTEFSLLATCASGQVLKWNGAAWGCADDDNPVYVAGGGLQGSANTFSLLGSCVSGQVLKWDGAAWGCAADADTQLDAPPGGGVTRTGSTLQLTACGNGQVLKYSAGTSAWACGDDLVGDPQLTYSAGAGLALDTTTFSIVPCTANEHLRWNGTTWACSKTWDGDPIGTAYGGLGQDLSQVAPGSIPYAAAAGQFAFRTPGAGTQVLRVVGGIPAWANATSGTVQTITAGTGLTGGTITGSGTIAADETYLATLGTAQTVTGEKTFGDGTIRVRNAAGTFSTTLSAPDATVDQSINLPNASGTVPVAAAAPLSISPTGTVSVPLASGTGAGVMQVGSGLAVTGGLVSVNYGAGANTPLAGNDSRLAPAPSAAGRMIYDNGSTWSALPAGSPGALFRSQGAAAPAWQSLQAAELPAHTHSASEITSGVLAVASGGTGASSVGVAGAVCYSTGSAYAFTDQGSPGQVLKSAGSAKPTWGSVSLTETSGTLSVSQGGTGQTGSLTAGGVIYASSTTTMASSAAGATNQVLGHTGSVPTWVGANAHDHVGQSWSRSDVGSVLTLTTSVGTGTALEASATSTGGTNFAVHAQTNSSTGRALYGFVNHAASSGARAVLGESPSTSTGSAALEGKATGASGAVAGVKGTSASTGGRGVFGEALATSGAANGVEGRSSAPSGAGVYGFASSASGSTAGVWGTATAAGGTGAVGQSSNGIGVRAISGSGSGRGVFASNTATTGDAFGLRAQTASSTGVALFGHATGSGVNYGVYGTTNSAAGFGLYTPDRAHVGQALSVVGNLSVGPSFSVNASTGQVTAASLAGSGAGLTNLSSANISGTFSLAQGGTGADLSGAAAGFVTKSSDTASGLTTVAGLDADDVTSGVLPVSRGGTGTGTMGSAGSVGYSNGSTWAYSDPGTAGQFLKSVGAGKPVFAKVDIGDSTQIQGTLGPANGGLGINTSAAAANSVLRTTATGTWSALAPGTDGQALTTTASGIDWAPITVPNGSITFAKWTQNGCAAGQFPVWSGSAWTCGNAGGAPPQALSDKLLGATNTSAFPSITTHANGLPIVAYGAVTGSFVLQMASCGDASCSSGNVVNSLASPNQPYHNTVRVGSDGLPFVSYLDNNATPKAIRVAHCNDSACSSATVTTIATGAFNISASDNVCMTIGKSGFPILAYKLSGLNLVTCSNASCSSFTLRATPLDSGSGVGGGCSMAIGIDGFPIISYNDTATGQKVVHCVDETCTGAVSPVPLESGGVGQSAIAVPPDGRPVMVYRLGSNVRVSKCDDVACASASATTVHTQDTSTCSGCTLSIAVPPDMLPVMTYRRQTSSATTLGFSKCTTAACSAVSTRELSTNNVVFSSITIGPDGFPLIAYGDGVNSEMRVIKCSNPYCLPFWQRR